MTQINFIPSKDNGPTHIYREENSSAYKYTSDKKSKENRVYFDAFIIDSDAIIFSGDLCVVTNTYDAMEYIERCERVTLDDGRKVFYGKEGTRCSLCDAAKIIATTNKVSQSTFVSGLGVNFLRELLLEKNLNNTRPNFF